ncbi:MAG: glycine cleavage T C-terminal barrel domain-containing protein [Planctomycetota bacterium]
MTPPRPEPRDLENDLDAEYIPFGEGDAAVPIAAHYGGYEAEYGAIRARVGVMHLPHRGLIDVRGDDRADFLHRLITNDVNGAAEGSTFRSLLLSQKGRIVADMFVHHGGLNTWLELDACDIPVVLAALESKLFAEDVKLTSWVGERVCLACHGPSTAALLKAVEGEPSDAVSTVDAMVGMPGTTHVVGLAGARVSASRRDVTGEVGVVLWAPTADAGRVYRALLEAAGVAVASATADAVPTPEQAQRRRSTLRGRPVGWMAFNTARLEAGQALFHVDFGPDAIPGELGDAALHEAVSFTKGCYVGQEIVARMKNLGHPKRVIVGLQLDDDTLPAGGSPVTLPPEPGAAATSGKPVGVVTSSTLSPLLGSSAIALAQVKWGQHQPGTTLHLAGEGVMKPATVTELPFVAR